MTKYETPKEIISIIGSSYFKPIAELVDHWVASGPTVRRDSVGTQFYADGYAVAVIVLLVAALESFVARDRHFSKKQPSERHVAVPEYMKEIYRYRGYKRLSELFVVRDSIIHSHVWLIKYALPKRGGRRFISAMRKDWSGNKRLKQRLNPKTYRTKLLRFNTIPSRIDGTDVVKAFKIVIAALCFLERRGANPVLLLGGSVQYQGQLISFESLPEHLAHAF
jgi:hypothetical protein